ncbi:hypothetical protein Taro_049931, partial [Colocasia esculenta]|nr:hypothetical protein [Colocasia esculenta]
LVLVKRQTTNIGKHTHIAQDFILVRTSSPQESYVQSLSNNSGFYYPKVQSPSKTLTHPAAAGLLFTIRRGKQQPRSHQVFLQHEGKQTPWNPQVFLHTKVINTTESTRDDTPMDQANNTMLDPKRILRGKKIYNSDYSQYLKALS